MHDFCEAADPFPIGTFNHLSLLFEIHLIFSFLLFSFLSYSFNKLLLIQRIFSTLFIGNAFEFRTGCSSTNDDGQEGVKAGTSFFQMTVPCELRYKNYLMID